MKPMGHLITVLGGVSLVVLLGGCEVDSAAGGATGDGGDDTDANLDFGLPPTPDAAYSRTSRQRPITVSHAEGGAPPCPSRLTLTQ